MHILHVTPYYAPAYAFGGVVRAVEGMACAQVKQGHQVTVLTTDALNQESRYTGADDEIIDGVRVIRRPNITPKLRGHLNISTPRHMKKVAENLMPEVDIVHLHEFRTIENLLVTPVAQAQAKPMILSPHGTLNLGTGRSALKKRWDRLLSPAVAQRIDHVIALVQAELEDCQELWTSFGRRQIPTEFSIIPNGIHLEELENLPPADEFRARYGLGDHPIVLFMGRLHPRKGIDVLILAFHQADIPDSRLLIVGPDEGMLDHIQPLLDERIVVTGYLDGIDRLAALASADIFALLAIGEGQSISVLEAMGAGLPVVLSHGCNMPDVEAFGAGYVLDVNSRQVADKLHYLLSHPQERDKMGARARQYIAGQYTWDKVAEQLDAVYGRYVKNGID